MNLALVLFLALAAEPPRSLSPEAGEHNTRAMRHYDAGEFGPAVDDFYAAYQAMPDARRDREGRLLLLGSMSATLRAHHRQAGDPAPLCRLQRILAEHLDALTAAYPDAPDMQEIRSVRARHDEVTQQLAAIDPAACAPPPLQPVAVVAPVTPEPPMPAPAPAPPKPAPSANPDAIPPRHLKIAGGVTLGLGGILLGVMTYGIVAENLARAAASKYRGPDCPLTPVEQDELQDLRSDALTGRRIAIGTGIAAGVTVALGGTLLALARRPSRAKRWSAAPWGSSTSAGLFVRVQLGSGR